MKHLVSRLLGMSVPNRSRSKTFNDEKKQTARLIDYLSTRRALYAPYDMEFGPYVTESVLETRVELVNFLQDSPPKSPLRDGIKAMITICLKYLDEMQTPYAPHYHNTMPAVLGEVRAIVGLHLARLSEVYCEDIPPPLDSILPPEIPDATQLRSVDIPTQFRSTP